ncbi:MAG TPA: flagellar basal body-associated FliL family protein [Gemmatimonadaceae bacterium]|nr:flagellar basal body-associated FliL family protein [Gemmatimonadaceae bacterium]
MADAKPTDETEAPAEAAPKQPKSKKSTIVAAFAVLAGVGAGIFGIAPLVAGKGTKAASADSNARHDSAGEHGAKAAIEPQMLENLVLNPAGTRGSRFLLLTVGVQLVDQVAKEELAKREGEARDRVLEVFATKTVDELVDVSRRPAFRAEIANVIDSLLGHGKVRGVFFPQFVVQ